VVDSWGRVHDTDNVYVVDGGFFPYAGGVNPTFTIQANALRISAEITRRLGASSAANSAEPAMHPMPTEEGHHV
jgi:paromamine 6'-oxidase/6'''-hydroxyneomycin C oxidase/2'-deamino-2'-hydroxyparomamine 6'-oxidase